MTGRLTCVSSWSDVHEGGKSGDMRADMSRSTTSSSPTGMAGGQDRGRRADIFSVPIL